MAMTLLYEAENALEAHMLVDLLAQQNLHARIDGEFLQGGVGEIQTSGLVRVLIDSDDFDDAKEIIRAWEKHSQIIDEVQPRVVHKTIGWFALLISFIAGLLVGMLSVLKYLSWGI